MRFSLALAALAFAGSLHAQEETSSRFRPYITADLGIGKLLDVEEDEDEDDPEQIQDMKDDLARPLFLSASGGLLLRENHIGFGAFYVKQSSKSTMEGEIPFISGVTLTSAEQGISIDIIGAQVVALPPVGSKAHLRGEFGLGKANLEQTVDLTMSGYDAGRLIELRNRTTIDYSGVALLVGAGLDVLFTPHFGIGAKVVLIRGEASVDDAEAKITVDGSSQTTSADTEKLDDADFSSINASIGLRLLF